LGPDKYEVVFPSVSILAEPPVTVVGKYAEANRTTEVAEAYLKFLYTQEGQTLAAKNFYRPSDSGLVDPKLLAQFPKIELFTIDDVFGGWASAHAKHFGEGGEFDKIAEAMGE
jgi:sulfate transport system substrate-binding protein